MSKQLTAYSASLPVSPGSPPSPEFVEWTRRLLEKIAQLEARLEALEP